MRLIGRVLSFAVALFFLGSFLALGLFFSLASSVLRQTTRQRVALGLASLAVMAGGIGALVYLARSSGLVEPLPAQPLEFPHVTHAGTLGISCVFCHRKAETGAAATFPSLQQCMFCHRVVPQEKPDIKRLVQAWEDEEPLDWVRVYRLPDSVHFDHQPHARAGVACAICHGPVETMRQVRPVHTLKMGDCLGCHRERSAPTDCSVCHY